MLVQVLLSSGTVEILTDVVEVPPSSPLGPYDDLSRITSDIHIKCNMKN